MYPAKLVKLGVSGAELRTECPMVVFDAVQMIVSLPAGTVTTFDSKVVAVTEQHRGDGQPSSASVASGGTHEPSSKRSRAP